MDQEMQYTKLAGPGHIKTFGQYFTKYEIANFMCSWACQNADTVLDPAAGNSIFLSCAKKHNDSCHRTGYEIDGKILNFFGNPSDSLLRNEDYLLNGWDEKYDAILCNPPYHRFQDVINRNEVIETIHSHTGIRCSGYTNLYILFLIKSIYQLSDTGRLAYIIPSEFMNSRYGAAVKQLFIEQQLLRAVINFENDSKLFFNATTTCCILLLDREPKNHAAFYNLASPEELTPDLLTDAGHPAMGVDYGRLSASDKWRAYLSQEQPMEYRNVTPIARFCSVSRGIATGANDFFCFSLPKAREHNIPERCLTKCICHSADIKTPVFHETDFNALSDSGKIVYLLDATRADEPALAAYLRKGQAAGVDKKYLPAHRAPWYSMEQKPAAPIWISPASRNTMKFVRNLAGAKSLTTFHSLFVREAYAEDTDIIFCYFLTPTAQAMIRGNRKNLGNGLDKFQPNDLNTAKMLDIRILSTQDKAKITEIYNSLAATYDTACVDMLDAIFSAYLQ